MRWFSGFVGREQYGPTSTRKKRTRNIWWMAPTCSTHLQVLWLHRLTEHRVWLPRALLWQAPDHRVLILHLLLPFFLITFHILSGTLCPPNDHCGAGVDKWLPRPEHLCLSCELSQEALRDWGSHGGAPQSATSVSITANNPTPPHTKIHGYVHPKAALSMSCS